MNIESRVGKIQASEQRVYELISDLNNLQNFVPPENVKDFKADYDNCSFSVDKMGAFSMTVVEREPNKLVKIGSGQGMPFKFNLWVQLKSVEELDTRVKVTLKADLNPMLKMMAKKPLTQFVSTLVDRLETIR